jgi:hypothetical protein
MNTTATYCQEMNQLANRNVSCFLVEPTTLELTTSAVYVTTTALASAAPTTTERFVTSYQRDTTLHNRKLKGKTLKAKNSHYWSCD